MEEDGGDVKCQGLHRGIALRKLVLRCFRVKCVSAKVLLWQTFNVSVLLGLMSTP